MCVCVFLRLRANMNNDAGIRHAKEGGKFRRHSVHGAGIKSNRKLGRFGFDERV